MSVKKAQRIVLFGLLSLLCAVLLPIQGLAKEPMLPNDDVVLGEQLSLPYGRPVSLKIAKILAAGAIAEAQKKNWTIDVAVVDGGGILVYFERMNNAQHASPIIAIEKAKTAAFFRSNTKLIEDRVKQGGLNYLGLPGAMPIDGGLPIVVEGEVLGAVAISGAKASEDGLCARAAVDALADALYFGKIIGKVKLPNGLPMAGGKLVVFKKGEGLSPNPSNYLRPPDDRVDIAEDGSFSVKLRAGDYFLSAIKNKAGELLGPPKEGDFVYPGPEKLQAGETLLSVVGGQVADIGTVAAIPFSESLLSKVENPTLIEGIVTDKDGKPIAGAIVFAFDSPKVVGKPLFVSERTGANGRFNLRISEGGTYYIKTRTSLWGGHPLAGEMIGVHGRGIAEPVKVLTGQVLKEIIIVGKPFVDYRKEPAKKKLEKQGAQ